ncbi:hypothetical protein GGD41_005299 [Paraburkholderia bryophila]|uniref:Uncharacterized protein n=1 Tax=Paraburkholderia bryophila TaxID=420952 RepID=A0A7Y9WC56_9BURK|nr:hypothetical protein [Paraburkholderia bryophila]
MHGARGAAVGVEAGVDRDFQRRIEQQARFEKRAPVTERALRDAEVRERAADKRDTLALLVEQMPHGEGGAGGVVEIHRAQARRPQIDQHERALHRDQRGERLGLDEAGNRDRVGRVQAQLLDHVFGRTGGQHRRHDAAFATGVFDTVQHVRKERADGEVVVLTVQQKGEPADARPQLRGVIPKLPRCFDDAFAGRLGQSRLVLQGA